MLSLFLKYLPVYIGSMFKFIFGPTLGLSIGLSVAETAVLTTAGMMTSVSLFGFLGEFAKKRLLKHYFANRKVFTKRNRNLVKFSRNVGVFGVSFLTPVLFSPILGTLLSVSLGGKLVQIFVFMLFSAIFWSIVITCCCKYLFEQNFHFSF